MLLKITKKIVIKNKFRIFVIKNVQDCFNHIYRYTQNEMNCELLSRKLSVNKLSNSDL